MTVPHCRSTGGPLVDVQIHSPSRSPKELADAAPPAELAVTALRRCAPGAADDDRCCPLRGSGGPAAARTAGGRRSRLVLDGAAYGVGATRPPRLRPPLRP